MSATVSACVLTVLKMWSLSWLLHQAIKKPVTWKTEKIHMLRVRYIYCFCCWKITPGKVINIFLTKNIIHTCIPPAIDQNDMCMTKPTWSTHQNYTQRDTQPPPNEISVYSVFSYSVKHSCWWDRLLWWWLWVQQPQSTEMTLWLVKSVFLLKHTHD